MGRRKSRPAPQPAQQPAAEQKAPEQQPISEQPEFDPHQLALVQSLAYLKENDPPQWLALTNSTRMADGVQEMATTLTVLVQQLDFLLRAIYKD